jgi:hypothetical protein
VRDGPRDGEVALLLGASEQALQILAGRHLELEVVRVALTDVLDDVQVEVGIAFILVELSDLNEQLFSARDRG